MTPDEFYRILLKDGTYANLNATNQESYDRRRLGALYSASLFNANRSRGCINVNFLYASYVSLSKVVRLDGLSDNCGKCTFKVFKNDQLILENITDADIGCPEVEKLDCRLSDETKKIKIDKTPWIHGIEVINFARGIDLLSNSLPVSFTAEIPKHCLNIYNTNVSGSIIPIPNLYLEFDRIKQIRK